MIRSPYRLLSAGVAATVVTALALTLAYPPPALAASGPCSPTEANGRSHPAGISANGRFALFTSTASNLVAGGTSRTHLYLRDLKRCTTELVDATATGGTPDIEPSGTFHLSADGRYAVFSSSAPDLLPGGISGDYSQIHLRDLVGRKTELISVGHDGSLANQQSWPAGVSTNGRYVLFVSQASNLLPGGPPPNFRNVYLRDRWRATTRLIATVPPGSVAPGWVPFLSPDGRFSLLDLTSPLPSGQQRWLTYLVDHVTLGSQLVSVSLNGGWPNQDTYSRAVSTGGRFALFHSSASDLVTGPAGGPQLYVRDTVAGQTVRMSDGPPASGGDITHDGRYVSFHSSASLAPGDTNQANDVFVRDLAAGTTVWASVAGNGVSDSAKISAQGRFVIFRSEASNLVPNDTNATADVFVRDLAAGTTVRVSVG